MRDSKSAVAACRPTEGSTYLTIGQDLFSIEEYLREQYNASLHEYIAKSNIIRRNANSEIPTLESFIPAAYMFYTDIQELRGLSQPVDYGSGIEFADGLLSFHNSQGVVALQIGLWLNGTAGCRDLLSGGLAEQVAQLYQYLMVECRASKIFLRVGYEFDNPYFGYSDNPDIFQQAFRFLVEACDQQYSRSKCSEKIAFAWHSWAAGTPDNTSLADFYPGDEYVDWIGVSVFSQLYQNPLLGNRETVAAVLDFAAAHEKPIMISESTPFGGVNILRDPWRDWFDPVLQLIEDYDIAMWSYINSDWESQPMWHNVGFGDTRLSTNNIVMQLWREHVLSRPRFITKLSCEDETLWSVSGLSSHLETHTIYWSVAIVVVVVVLCVFRDVLVLCCRRNGCYEALLDDEDENEPVRIVEPIRTGYGTLN